MQPVTTPAAAGGFTLIEALVALAILSVLLALGVPAMSDWVRATKASGAAEFYVEGYRLARAEALRHNSAARVVLTENAGNGQMDWQVDLCFPTATTPCSSVSGSWSTTAAPAGADPEGANGRKSVFRSAAALPPSDQLVQTLSPAGSSDLYFTSLGWVDTNFAARLSRIDLAPPSASAGAFPSSAVVITLAGLASKCDPNAVAHDSRGCPP
jgi:type IV fimbrial biogenesis protein FimT